MLLKKQGIINFKIYKKSIKSKQQQKIYKNSKLQNEEWFWTQTDEMQMHVGQ